MTSQKYFEGKIQESIDALLETSYLKRVENLQEAIKFCNKALKMSKQYKLDYDTAKAHNLLGLFFMIKGDFKKSIRYSNKGLQYFESVSNNHGIGLSKYNLGCVYYRTSNFYLGLEYLLECLVIFNDEKDYHNSARALKSLGTMYEYFGDTDNAINFYIDCIKTSKICGDLNSESNALSALSGLVLKKNEVKKAMAYAKKSIRLKIKTADKRGLAYALYSEGKVFMKLKLVKDATENFKQSISIHHAMGDKLGEGLALNKLGQLYYEQSDLTKAQLLFKKALKRGVESKSKLLQFKSNYNLYLVYKKEKNITKACLFLEQYLKEKEYVANNQSASLMQSYYSLYKIKMQKLEALKNEEKNEIIKKKNHELDSVFYRISHDIKGPISTLIGLHNLVKIEIEDQKSLMYFDLYYNQISRVNNIITDVVEIIRLNDPVIMNKTEIDFKIMIQECIRSNAYIKAYHNINFITNIEEHLPYFSEWNVVRTILFNLIENAVRYSDSEKQSYIRVDVKQCKNFIQLLVADNGIGINPKYKPKIFDLFYRASSDRSGVGLGLYIVKSAVDRLHGKITVSSKLYEKSEFVIDLPVTF